MRVSAERVQTEGCHRSRTGLANVGQQLLAISSMTVSLSSGLTLSNMAQAQRKLCKRTDLLKTMLLGEQSLKSAIRHLRRRYGDIMKGMSQELKPHNTYLQCSVLHSWEQSMDKADDTMSGALSRKQMLCCHDVIQRSGAVSLHQLLVEAGVDSWQIDSRAFINSCLDQLLCSTPVLIVRHCRTVVVLDIHQFVMSSGGDGLTELLCLNEDDDDDEDMDDLPDKVPLSDDESDIDETLAEEALISNDRSEKLKHEEFPQLVEEVRKFLELHGCAAQSRRRSDVANSLGVTLEDLRQHLLSVIPGLKQSGLSRTTVHELLTPPRMKTRNAKRYKNLINCQVGVKKNDLPLHNHSDRHFCASQVKMAMEFAVKYSHIAIISANDMNKVNIGVAAIISFDGFTMSETRRPVYVSS